MWIARPRFANRRQRRCDDQAIGRALPQCGIDQRIDCSKLVGIAEEANRFPDLGKQKSKTANLIGNAR